MSRDWKDEEQYDCENGDEDFVADEYIDEYDGGRPEMTLKRKSNLNTRARNVFGADGTVLRIACFVGVTTLIVLGIVFGVNHVQSSSNSSSKNQLRQPPSNKNIFEEYDWIELPANVQEAAKVLGYNKGSWDHDVKTEHFNKDWNELSIVQQNAATILGYTPKMWCDDVDDVEVEVEVEYDNNNNENEVSSGGVDNVDKYEEFDWDELPDNVKLAAIILGYTQVLWDNDQHTSTTVKDWMELTQEEKQAATTLGYYNEQTWCNGR